MPQLWKRAISAIEWVQTGQNGWPLRSRSVIQRHLSLYMACYYKWCVCGISGLKRVVCRNKLVLYHVRWPRNGMTTILFAWSLWAVHWSKAKGVELSASMVCHCFLRAWLAARTIASASMSSNYNGNVNAVTGMLSGNK